MSHRPPARHPGRPPFEIKSALIGPLAASARVDAPADMASEVSERGVTFTFDAPYRVGQYVDGSWWVLRPVGGSVTITSITPAGTQLGGDDINGAMRDPGNFARYFVDKDTPYGQSFDERSSAYDATHNIDPGRTGAPIVLDAEATIVKAVATLTDPGDQYLESLVPLTVVDVVPPTDAFRPPQSVADKSGHLFRDSEMLRHILPRLAVQAMPDRAALEAAFPASTWFVHNTQKLVYQGVSPRDVSGNYKRTMVAGWHQRILYTFLDVPQSDKEFLMRQMVQLGLDIYGRTKEGGLTTAAASLWGESAGHAMGIKPILAYVAALFDHPEMRALLDGTLPNFVEDSFVYTVRRGDVERNTTLQGKYRIEERGAGYQVGDLLTYAPLQTRRPLFLDVTEVDGNGKINKFEFSAPDIYHFPEGEIVPLAGGSGSGAVFNLEFKIATHSPGMIGSPESCANEQVLSARGSNYDLPYKAITDSSFFDGAVIARLIGAEADYKNPSFFEYVDRYYRTPTVEPVGSANGPGELAAELYETYLPPRYSTAPTLQGAAAEGRFVWLTYDQLLCEETWPAAGDFTVSGGRTVQHARIFGYAVILYIDTPFAVGDSPTVSYTPGAAPVANINDIQAGAVTGQAVTVQPVWTPAELFQPGDEGFYLDPLVGVPEESQGAGLQTEGGAVGFLDDLSGNGNHAIQTSPAAKPILYRDDVKQTAYLDFVVDQYLTTPYVAANEQTAAVTVWISRLPQGRHALMGSSEGGADFGLFYESFRCGFELGSAEIWQDGQFDSRVQNEYAVLIGQNDATTMASYERGGFVFERPWSGALPSLPVYIGGRNDDGVPNQHGESRIALAFAIDRSLSEDERHALDGFAERRQEPETSTK